jgi:oligoribonuclease NrnB/cAMP/cGMP phosphodiesterase (DHH superfamily)
MFKIVLFTHDDMDGAGCAIVFIIMMKNKKNVDFKVIHCSNRNINDKVQEAMDNGTVDEHTHICFGDISPSEEMAKKLVEFSKETIRVWDHHATSSYISDIIPGAKIVVENEDGKPESGTSLIYKFFSNVPGWKKDKELYNIQLLEDLVDNIRSYDTYEWKKTNNLIAQRLNTLCKLIGIKRFVDTYVERISNKKDVIDDIDGHPDPLIEDKHRDYIDSSLEQEQEHINSITIDDVHIVTIKGLKAAVRFSGGAGINEVASQFLAKHPDIDVFIDLGVSKGYYSFRAIRDDIDIGTILAKPLGGGGHHKAAGASISKELQDKIFNLLIDNISNA